MNSVSYESEDYESEQDEETIHTIICENREKMLKRLENIRNKRINIEGKSLENIKEEILDVLENEVVDEVYEEGEGDYNSTCEIENINILKSLKDRVEYFQKVVTLIGINTTQARYTPQHFTHEGNWVYLDNGDYVGEFIKYFIPDLEGDNYYIKLFARITELQLNIIKYMNIPGLKFEEEDLGDLSVIKIYAEENDNQVVHIYPSNYWYYSSFNPNEDW